MLSFVILYLSIVLLSLAMTKHFKATFERNLSESHSLKLKSTGWLLLLLSLYLVPAGTVTYVIWLTQASLIILLQSWTLAKIKKVRESQKRKARVNS